jgi:DNA modification methylase
MAKQDKEERAEALKGPAKGDFIAPPELTDTDERTDALPQQEEFWRPPVRFGSVPVEKEPLGWDRRRGFRKLFPQVMLPFQVVERVPFGHPTLEPNRLFWGDNLHVMRQLPSESIDLIYIDPPFFSGRQYNVIFGDQNELRSFSDIWEGGLPGYLIWLNARLYEMKRLLRKSGSIIVHCDHHASHYIKVEMDKIFGYDHFMNEIVWSYESGGRSKNFYPRKHDALLWYGKQTPYFSSQAVGIPRNMCAQCGQSLEKWNNLKKLVDNDGRTYRTIKSAGKIYKYYDDEPTSPSDVWLGINHLQQKDPERIGYPTQKPERLLERAISGWCPNEGLVADFFCGGGTTAAVAQRLKRRWIACDQSRVAVAITEDRLTRQVEERTGKMFSVPDFTVEHWGVYEAQRLAQTPPDQFRAFVLRAFGAVPEENEGGIHGYKGAVPVWIGEADQKKAVTAQNVQDFSNAIRKTLRYKQDNLRDGIMLAWAFRPDAVEAQNACVVWSKPTSISSGLIWSELTRPVSVSKLLRFLQSTLTTRIS